jgi:hypothetical protein
MFQFDQPTFTQFRRERQLRMKPRDNYRSGVDELLCAINKRSVWKLLQHLLELLFVSLSRTHVSFLFADVCRTPLLIKGEVASAAGSHDYPAAEAIGAKNATPARPNF